MNKYVRRVITNENDVLLSRQLIDNSLAMIEVDSTGEDKNIYLPDAVDTRNIHFYLVNIGTGNVNIYPSNGSGNLVSGGNVFQMTSQYEVKQLHSNGINDYY